MSEFDEEIEPDAPIVRGGIQSLDAALTLLRVLASMPGPVSLSELARLADMPLSKVHRYLASFIKADIVTQRHRSGQYDLGSGAIELGLAAMARLDFVNRAADRLEEIVDATGAAALLAIWGTHGPTVVRWQRASSFVITSIGLGTTLPLLNSASGHIFLAYSPERLYRSLLQQELRRARALSLRWPDLDPVQSAVSALCARVRALGYAVVDGRFIPGLNAISAPILNWQGEVEAAVTVTAGDTGVLDPDGPALRLLLETTRQLSITDVLRPVR